MTVRTTLTIYQPDWPAATGTPTALGDRPSIDALQALDRALGEAAALRLNELLVGLYGPSARAPGTAKRERVLVPRVVRCEHVRNYSTPRIEDLRARPWAGWNYVVAEVELIRDEGDVDLPTAITQLLWSKAHVEPVEARRAEGGFFIVRLRVTRTDEGGRRFPVFSGYRPNWDIGNLHEGQPTFNDAMLSVEQAPHLEPGAEGTVRVHPLSPELWAHVVTGQHIKMQEGSRVVGEGVVLEVVPPARTT